MAVSPQFFLRMTLLSDMWHTDVNYLSNAVERFTQWIDFNAYPSFYLSLSPPIAFIPIG